MRCRIGRGAADCRKKKRFSVGAGWKRLSDGKDFRPIGRSVGRSRVITGPRVCHVTHGPLAEPTRARETIFLSRPASLFKRPFRDGLKPSSHPADMPTRQFRPRAHASQPLHPSTAIEIRACCLCLFAMPSNTLTRSLPCLARGFWCGRIASACVFALRLPSIPPWRSLLQTA